MSNTGSQAASKYVLMYYEPRHPESAVPYDPPQDALESILSIAWHNHDANGQNESITQGERVIFYREELDQACARLGELRGEQPHRDLLDIAAQVLRETGKA